MKDGEQVAFTLSGHSFCAEIKKAAKGTSIIGTRIHCFAEAGSTSDLARDFGRRGASEGTTVIASTQDEGRGRLGRRWISPEGGIWFSTVLRPNIGLKDASKLTLTFAVAVAEIIRRELKLKAEIRWPNDILVKGRKVGGVLGEATAGSDGRVSFVVVGVGLNANVDLTFFPTSIRGTITSFREELKRDVKIADFLVPLFQALEKYYLLFLDGGFEPVLSEWRKLAGFLGSRVKATCVAEKLVGRAVDVDVDGALLIKLEDGTEKKIFTGDLLELKPE